MTQRRITAIYPGTAEVALDWETIVANTGARKIGVTVKDSGNSLYAEVFVSDLIKALQDVPGVTAEYKAPVAVPARFGAVVESAAGRRYVLADEVDRRHPWYSAVPGEVDAWFSNDHVAEVLKNSGRIVTDGPPPN